MKEPDITTNITTAQRVNTTLLVITIIAGLVDVAIWCVVAWQTAQPLPL